jgi:hypothetical protein
LSARPTGAEEGFLENRRPGENAAEGSREKIPARVVVVMVAHVGLLS